jgi:hypothetical protein
VIADPFDHRVRAGVAHGEPLTDHSAQECLAAGGAEQDDVAADDVVFGDVVRRRVVGRPHHDPAPGQSLAHVVVRIAVDP